MHIKEKEMSLVMHLRNVHFLIVLMTIFVFFFTVPPKKISILELESEYSSFDRFTKKIKANPNFVSSACYQYISSLKLNDEYKSVLNLNNDSSSHVLLKSEINSKSKLWKLKKFREKSSYCELSLTFGFRQFVIGSINDVYRHQVGFGEDLSRQTKNLFQFIDLWNGFAKGIVIHQLKAIQIENSFVIKENHRSKIISGDLIQAKLSLVKTSELDKLNGRTIEYRFSLIRNRIREFNRIVAFAANDPMSFYLLGSRVNENRKQQAYLLILPLQSTRKTFSVQGQMLAQFSLTQIGQGDFKASFPHLFEFMSSHKGLYQLKDLYVAIQHYKNLDLSSYSFFGLELKIMFLARIASFAILGLMFYYWLLVRGILFRLKNNMVLLSGPWMGLFSDKVSFFVTLFSTVFMPTIVCAFNVVRYFMPYQESEPVLMWSVISLLMLVSSLVMIYGYFLHRHAVSYQKEKLEASL